MTTIVVLTACIIMIGYLGLVAGCLYMLNKLVKQIIAKL